MERPVILSLTLTATAYGILVLIAELTFGDPGFPYWLWRFTTIAPLAWSLPVHSVGYVWLYAWTVTIRRRMGPEALLAGSRLMLRTIIPAALIGTGYYLVFEALNLFVLGFFSYSPTPLGLPLGAAASFWLVIILYLVLSLVSAGLLLILPKAFKMDQGLNRDRGRV